MFYCGKGVHSHYFRHSNLDYRVLGSNEKQSKKITRYVHNRYLYSKMIPTETIVAFYPEGIHTLFHSAKFIIKTHFAVTVCAWKYKNY